MVCHTPYFLRIPVVKNSAVVFYLKLKKQMKFSHFTVGRKNVKSALESHFYLFFSRGFQQRTAIFYRIPHIIRLLISNKCMKVENFKLFLYEYLKWQQCVLCLTVQLQLNISLVCKQGEKYLNVYNSCICNWITIKILN